MTSEKQLAANRRNASKSTGPKSETGKQRSSNNSYRHGLSVPVLLRSEVKFKELARRYAGGATDRAICLLAEQAADAHLDLERVRKTQAAMVGGAQKSENRVQELKSLRAQILLLDQASCTQAKEDETSCSKLEWIDVPGKHDENELQSIRQSLPELVKTSRYERRALSKINRVAQMIVTIQIANAKNNAT